MPDPNITHAAIQSHASTLQGAIGRNLANAGRCKCWGAAIVAVMLLAGTGKVQLAALAWASAVVVLLAFADACCVALSRQLAEAYNRFMARVPLNGGNMPKAEEWLVVPKPDLGLGDVARMLGALASFSVWPFYAALLALVITFYVQTAQTPAGNGAPTTPIRISPSTNVVPQPGTKPPQTTLKPLPPATGTHPSTRVIPQPANPQPRTIPQPPSAAPKLPAVPPGSGSPAANPIPPSPSATIRPATPSVPSLNRPLPGTTPAGGNTAPGPAPAQQP